MLNATPEQYAEATRQLLKAGRSLEELNQANHMAIDTKEISIAQFQAAARVLAMEILKR